MQRTGPADLLTVVRHGPGQGVGGPERGVVFYYDLASPEAYLAAERVHGVLPEPPEWQPVRLDGLRAGEVGPFRCEHEVLAYREDVERRAADLGLQPLRWPEPFPADTGWAMLAATYAKEVGRAVAFALAAFRQAFAGGRDLGERDNVLIAAAACELHPAALVKGAALTGTRRRLEEATAAAAAAGVLEVPAVRVGDRVFHGERELEAAAAALAAGGS
jgi:2-hydroxychromene-2-carboxylate isomerase